jgi:hypothetical protein
VLFLVLLPFIFLERNNVAVLIRDLDYFSKRAQAYFDVNVDAFDDGG